MFANDVIPLWAVASIEKGGLNFGTGDVGSLLATGGVFMLISTAVLYPIIASRFRYTSSFVLITILCSIALYLEPVLTIQFIDQEKHCGLCFFC